MIWVAFFFFACAWLAVVFYPSATLGFVVVGLMWQALHFAGGKQ